MTLRRKNGLSIVDLVTRVSCFAAENSIGKGVGGVEFWLQKNGMC